jgi:drug/metabolite transporter (DMT)-like permease
MLLGITVVWGWTFLIVKDAVAAYPVADFLALRFVLASILLAPLALPGLSRRSLVAGAIIGVPLACAYLFQTLGLVTTSAANAGLLTGLFVVFTPLFDRFLYRTPLASITIMSAIIGLVGTAMLTTGGGQGFGLGDAFEVLTAVALGVHTVILSRRSVGYAPEHLAFGQMALAAAIFLLMAGASGGMRLPAPSSQVWIAVLITGTVASALAFWVQTFVQQRLSPSRAAIILLAEPAFATAFAVWLGGERLNPLQWGGAALIFLSLISHEIWISTRKPGEAQSCNERPTNTRGDGPSSTGVEAHGREF